MKPVVVRRARLFEVALPLREPFQISGGTLRERRSLIVVLDDDDGNVGYGESAPFEFPFYSAETTTSARELLTKSLLPRVLAEPFSGSGQLLEVLSEGVVGNRMAIAGAETAWWDLHAAREGKTLADLVTARLTELKVDERWLSRSHAVQCGVALGIPEGHDVSVLRRWVQEAIARGYRRIKLKVKPGWDIEPVNVTRSLLAREGSEIPVTVDANGAFNLDQHMEILRGLDGLGLLYIEQPLAADMLWDLRKLGECIETPVCLDETLTSDGVARQVLDMGGPTVWNIKIQRVGGLEEACRIYSRAVRAGVRLWGGTMPETGIGAQTMLALGCHEGFVFPSDLEPSERWYAPGTDLAELTMSANGLMKVPTHRIAPKIGGAWKLVCDLG